MKHSREPATTLAGLQRGQRARVTGLEATGMVRRRMMDLGLLAGAEVEVIMASPLGDPRAYLVRGTMLALRERDARGVRIEVLADGELSDGSLS